MLHEVKSAMSICLPDLLKSVNFHPIFKQLRENQILKFDIVHWTRKSVPDQNTQTYIISIKNIQTEYAKSTQTCDPN